MLVLANTGALVCGPRLFDRPGGWVLVSGSEPANG